MFAWGSPIKAGHSRRTGHPSTTAMPSTRRTKLAATAAHKARRVRKPVLSDKARKNAQRACLGWARRSVKNDLAKMRAAAVQMAGVRGATLYHAEYLRCLEQEIARLETAAVVQQPAPAALVQQPAPAGVVPVAPMPEAMGEVDGGDDDNDQDGDAGEVQDANPGDDDQDDEGQDQDGDDDQDDEDQDQDDDGDQDGDAGEDGDANAGEDKDANAGDDDQDDAGDDGAPRGMPMKVCLCCGGLVPQTARLCFNSGRKKRACKPPKPLRGPPCGSSSRELHKTWPLKMGKA